MGPLLLHNKNIKLMDWTLRSVAEKRYEADMEKAHKILFELFEKQPDIYCETKKKEKWWVEREDEKFIGHGWILREKRKWVKIEGEAP